MITKIVKCVGTSPFDLLGGIKLGEIYKVLGTHRKQGKITHFKIRDSDGDINYIKYENAEVVK